MPLNNEDRNHLKTLLTILFEDKEFLNIQPTEQTLQLTEEYLLKISECEKRISRLLFSLPCGLIGRGFLRRCLRGVVKLMKDNQLHFSGCELTMRSYYRGLIYSSGI